MSEKVPQKYLVQIVKDVADGEFCKAGPDAMSVDLAGQGWINPLAPCHRFPINAEEGDTSGFTGLIIQNVGNQFRVLLSSLRGHRYTRAPRPELYQGEEWIPVAEFVDPD